MSDPTSLSSSFATLLYLDAGSSGWLLQAIIAGLASMAVFLKYQGRRIAGWLGVHRSADESPDGTAGSASPAPGPASDARGE